MAERQAEAWPGAPRGPQDPGSARLLGSRDPAALHGRALGLCAMAGASAPPAVQGREAVSAVGPRLS